MERVFFTEGWASGYIVRILDEYEKNLEAHNIEEYTDVLESFAIIPESVDEDLRQHWKERKYMSHKHKFVDVRLWILLEDFTVADKEGKRQLIIDNIVNSALVIRQKTKGHFDVKKFLKDALGEDFARAKLNL